MFLSLQSLFSTQMTASPFCTLRDCLMVHVEREGEHRCWPHPSCSVTLCHHWWHIIVDTWLQGLFKCQECPKPWIHILMWSSLHSAPLPFVQELSLHLFPLFPFLFSSYSLSLSFSCFTNTQMPSLTIIHTYRHTPTPSLNWNSLSHPSVPVLLQVSAEMHLSWQIYRQPLLSSHSYWLLSVSSFILTCSPVFLPSHAFTT